MERILTKLTDLISNPYWREISPYYSLKKLQMDKKKSQTNAYFMRCCNKASNYFADYQKNKATQKCRLYLNRKCLNNFWVSTSFPIIISVRFLPFPCHLLFKSDQNNKSFFKFAFIYNSVTYWTKACQHRWSSR